MESLNIVDGIVIVLVLISAILAYARGLTREIMAIMGWVFSSIISFVFAPSLGILAITSPADTFCPSLTDKIESGTS